ncbi:DUF397 domain-containing protein [Actinomadura sp. WMMA1423]|uniref:DUF397 domain-containing protein n=1 Tax=Actinomadura sp. WMMA1423 TaxID=2591108 RepID=UPI0011472F06|nr:DUF397 domain-containing protein [Actinomadura sp. WMMA1423]
MDLSRATWRKATRSNDSGANCVEVGSVPGVVALRDSKDPHGPVLVLSRSNFRRFTEALKHAHQP